MDRETVDKLARQHFALYMLSGSEDDGLEVFRKAITQAVNEALEEAIAIVPQHVSPAMADCCQDAIRALKLRE